MRKLFVGMLLGTAFLFQYCSSSKKAASAKSVAAVTYEGNIKPIVQASCTPCHIEGKGNKKPLDNYKGASSTIDEIIARIQKNPDERGFMPARHPKLPDATIQQFVSWKQSGLTEK
ncbi:MAG TPA: cytochrome c [Flavisolibacter sp.]|nr:cytochrome c [Flavisolibacter sp.]